MKNVCRAFSGFQTDIDRCGAKPVRVGKVRGGRCELSAQWPDEF